MENSLFIHPPAACSPLEMLLSGIILLSSFGINNSLNVNFNINAVLSKITNIIAEGRQLQS